MPRSFDLSASYPASVEQVRVAFGHEAYWLARLADSGADYATLDSMVVTDGQVVVETTQALRSDRLPAVVSQVHPGDLEIVRSEAWSRVIDGRAHAQVSGAVRGAPVSLAGAGELGPTLAGSEIRFTVSVQVDIPLIGGKVEGLIGTQLAELIAAEQRFTTLWIAAHG
jgi:Protein of unknown function (DUF2505)